MELLLHICCAPCSLLSWQDFQVNLGFAVTGYFFNPNIHPYQEFARRKEALRSLGQQENRTLLLEEKYLLETFLRAVVGQEENRCSLCYEMRLHRTALLAKEMGIERFSTTLLISPYQNHELIAQTGQRIAREQGLQFIYRDLRPLFSESMKQARGRSIYTQGYCGCIYSEKERYAKDD